jgi:hypothetical protein
MFRFWRQRYTDIGAKRLMIVVTVTALRNLGRALVYPTALLRFFLR